MAYVYEHWRLDINLPFYVGKGSGRRSHLIRRRNKHHAAIVEKLENMGLGVEVRIVLDGCDDATAFAAEIERISHWKDRGVRLVNQSAGGRGGLSGCKRSEESRRKQSETTTGRQLSAEHIEKLLARVRSPEFRLAVSAHHKGRKRPPSTGEKISAGGKSAWADPIKGPARREALSKSASGRITTEQTKQKQRQAKTPEIREQLAQTVKGKWAEPGERERRSKAMSLSNAGRVVSDAARSSLAKAMTPERRSQSGRDLKDRWADPDKRREMSASLSAARTGFSLSAEHKESLRRSWTPARKRIVSEKMKQIRANKKDWGK